MDTERKIFRRGTPGLNADERNRLFPYFQFGLREAGFGASAAFAMLVLWVAAANS